MNIVPRGQQQLLVPRLQPDWYEAFAGKSDEGTLVSGGLGPLKVTGAHSLPRIRSGVLC